jgi:arylsulfatase A-like enzyme
LQEGLEAVKKHIWMADETTLAQFLSAAGYETALVGKWHCGQGDQQQPGFDHWFSLGLAQGGHLGKHTYWKNGKPIELSGYKSTIITDSAIEFLRTRNGKKPFFLFVGYIATHTPWLDHPERLVAPYRTCTFQDIPNDVAYPFGRLSDGSKPGKRINRREALAQYYGAVSEIDEQVGRLIDHLDAQGLRENTLVVYVADHGLNCGHHGVWGKGGGTRPLNMLEESIRIPLIFNGLSELYPGQVRAEFVDHCDLFQTLLDCADVTLPEAVLQTRHYPGRSFKPLLLGVGIHDWKTEVFGEYGNLRMIRTRTHKLIRRYPDGPCELFDLVADPRETVNLLHMPDRQSLVQELTARLNAFFSQYEDPAKTGLHVQELPVHNAGEAWREGRTS